MSKLFPVFIPMIGVIVVTLYMVFSDQKEEIINTKSRTLMIIFGIIVLTIGVRFFLMFG